MRTIVAVLVGLASTAFAIWLGIWYMLVGGIAQAVDNWGGDTQTVTWGIVRAFFALPVGSLVFVVGLTLAFFIGTGVFGLRKGS